MEQSDCLADKDKRVAILSWLFNALGISSPIKMLSRKFYDYSSKPVYGNHAVVF